MTRWVMTGLLLFGACSEPAAPAVDAAADAGVDLLGACVALLERATDCADAYLALLIDLRIAHDEPPGLAERGATPEGRAELVDTARLEWHRQAGPDRRAATCRQMIAGAPAEDLRGAAACARSATCDAFVACVRPFEEKRLR